MSGPHSHRRAEFPAREAHKALASKPASSAWWYENESSIGVYIYQVNGPTFSCSISMRALKGFIHRANRAKQEKRK